MRKLVITTTLHILPPLAGKVAEQHETEGGYIYLPPTSLFYSGTSSVNGGRILLSNAKSLLGQEFPYAIYDMRTENGVNFNLDAFAIVAGTIQRNGTLYLLCPNWDTLENEVDFDSLRWNHGKAITTPNFWAFFKALVQKYRFNYIEDCRGELHSPQKLLGKFKGECYSPLQLNAEQQDILQNLPLHSAEIHLITAPRGRGKSTLAGKLAEKISQYQRVIITSRAKSALPSFWKQIENRQNIDFFAPDHLIQAVEYGENFANCWLFIDEAGSLPLPMLQKLCSAFDKVVMTTTTQNYEGTGRGFELKLPKMLNKPYRHWTLSQPLRWKENDQLEEFVNDLLLLSPLPPKCLWHFSPLSLRGEGQIFALSKGEKQGEGIKPLIAFYNLLASAHYKTTPTDLRRLFDSENQQLFEIREHQQLIAGCWGVVEGGLTEDLTQAIWRGERRPAGSLVAQYLCFQGNLPQATALHSVRISRIAVTPEKQGQGYGKRLVSEVILQISKQNAPLVDFVSVSFGMNEALLAFWRGCGFRLVQVSQQPEASSGLLSAMMIYPLSERGKAFAEFAENRFERYIRLQKNGENQPLDDWDWRNLQGFAEAQRTFSACYTSLKRLYISNPDEMHEFSAFFVQNNGIKNVPDRDSVKMLRKIVQNTLSF